MIRLTFMLRRKPDLTIEEFQRYWREEHGPLVASVAHKLNILRYVQTHSIEDSLGGQLAGEARGAMEYGYEGVADLWWESETAREGMGMMIVTVALLLVAVAAVGGRGRGARD